MFWFYLFIVSCVFLVFRSLGVLQWLVFGFVNYIVRVMFVGLVVFSGLVLIVDCLLFGFVV